MYVKRLTVAVLAIACACAGCEPQPIESPTGDAAARCYSRGGEWVPYPPKPGEIQKPGTEGTGKCVYPNGMPTP